MAENKGAKHVARVGVSEASRLADTSRTQLYRLMKSGKLSYSLDEQGERRIDSEELLRVFGQLKQPVTQQETPTPATPLQPGTPNVTARDSDLVAVLKAQLAHEQEQNRRLLELLAQAQQLALPAGHEKSWWQFWK